MAPWQASDGTSAYVDPAQRAAADPYLAWADATAFADLTREGDALPGRVRVVVELAADVSAQALADALGSNDHVPARYRAGRLRHCTASFSAADCRRYAVPGPDNSLVARFEMAQPVLPRRSPRRPPGPGLRRAAAAAPAQATGPVLLAVVDNGCPFAHAAFRRGTGARVLSLWDQDPLPDFGTEGLRGAPPAGLGYGCEVLREELEALMAQHARGRDIDEGAVYEAAGQKDLRRAASHGAHVMDQLIGPVRQGNRIALTPDEPPDWQPGDAQHSDRADLVFVQMPRDVWADPNGLALAASVLDAMHHVLSCRTDAVKRVVVNISCAVHTGPHDGSTLLDQALLELVDLLRGQGCELVIVVPAGNSRQARWHAAGLVTPGNPGELRLRVPPGCESPTFLHLWVQGDAGALAWHVRAPGGSGGAVPPTGAWQLPGSGGGPLAWALRSHSTARGKGGTVQQGGTLLFLALAAAPGPDAAGAAGDWLIRLDLDLPPGSPALMVQARVARNESEMDAPPRHRPSHLVDAGYDPQRYLRAQEDDRPRDPAQALTVRRDGTRSPVVEGAGVVAAGGWKLRPTRQPAPYSSAGLPPTRSAAGLSDESRVLPGIRGAGTRSGGVMRLQGSSFAAPQLARAFADRPLPGEKDPLTGGDTRLFVVPEGAADRLGAVLVLPQRQP